VAARYAEFQRLSIGGDFRIIANGAFFFATAKPEVAGKTVINFVGVDDQRVLFGRKIPRRGGPSW